MSKTTDAVISRYIRREHEGLKKYGATMDRTDLSASAWAMHLQEELMDATLYLERVQAALLLLTEAAVLINKQSSPSAREWLHRYESMLGQRR